MEKIGKTELKVLNAIYTMHYEQATQEQIRKKLNRKSSLYKQLDSLEKKGLIRSFKKRPKIYNVTDKGARLIISSNPNPKISISHIEKRIGAGKKKEIDEFIEKDLIKLRSDYGKNAFDDPDINSYYFGDGSIIDEMEESGIISNSDIDDGIRDYIEERFNVRKDVMDFD